MSEVRRTPSEQNGQPHWLGLANTEAEKIRFSHQGCSMTNDSRFLLMKYAEKSSVSSMEQAQIINLFVNKRSSFELIDSFRVTFNDQKSALNFDDQKI
ncbi:hypothetical protein ACTXT7_000375 [Hymenolepis weldensis]